MEGGREKEGPVFLECLSVKTETSPTIAEEG
jgi:hypothetical protein